jgi:hypothetical protein
LLKEALSLYTCGLPEMADPDFKILELARSAHHVPLVGEEHRKVQRDGGITGVQAHRLKATDGLLLHKQIRNLGLDCYVDGG